MTVHILGHKNKLNKYKRSEIMQKMISDQNEIKLEKWQKHI